MNVIGILNEKGGVGKTSTSVNLAYYLAKQGNKVCLIDFDPQGSAGLSYGIKVTKEIPTIIDCLDINDEKPLSISNVAINKFGVDIVPSNNKLSSLASLINDQFGAHDLLHDAIQKVKKKYDYVIIDSAPQHGLLEFNVMRACTGIILAVQTKFLSVHASNKVINTLNAMNKKIKGCKCKLIGLLPTFYQTNIKESVNSLDVIKKHFDDHSSPIKKAHPDAIIFSPIKNNTTLSVCTSKGVPIGEFDKSSTGAKCYELMAKELLESNV